jgi:hypothetical protein
MFGLLDRFGQYGKDHCVRGAIVSLTQHKGRYMLKFLGGTLGVIFLIGLAVVIGLLALIF